MKKTLPPEKQRTNKVSNNLVPPFWKEYFPLLLLLLITLIVYSPALKNGFITKWDDRAYIVDNPKIALTADHIKSSFLHGDSQYGEGKGMMYVPLTSLSFSLNYYFSGFNPFSYHLVNILLHLISVVLVYFLVKRLFVSNEVAIITASFFALHTLQVEAVAFAAGRRDLLFSLFFILSCLLYVKYLDTGKNNHYIYALLLFIPSLLSKGQAVTLPITLLLFDYLKGRNLLSRKVIYEKIPFFLLSLMLGLMVLSGFGTVDQNTASGAITISQVPFYVRLTLACYGFVTYLFKLILPIHLSVIHPYPFKEGISLPTEYYLYPVLLILFLILVVFMFTRGHKLLAWGVLFFSINIVLVLQLTANSYGIINEHYVYLPSIGIFILLATGAKWLIDKGKKQGLIMRGVLITCFVLLGFYSFSRCQIWKNDITLFSDVITKYPEDRLAYNNCGLAYYDLKTYDKAIDLFSKAIAISASDAVAYSNRGSAYYYLGKYDEAIQDYSMSVKLKPDYAAYGNRANAYLAANKFEEALRDYDILIKLKPDQPLAYYNRGNAYYQLQKYQESVSDYDFAIKLKSDYADAYYGRGSSHYFLKKEYLLAIKDFEKCVKIQPNYLGAYINCGSAYLDLQKYEEAIKCYDMAIKVKPDYDKAYYNRGNAYTSIEKYELAISDFNYAIKLNPNYALAYYNRGNNYAKLNKYKEAIADWRKAMQLSPAYAEMLQALINNASRK